VRWGLPDAFVVWIVGVVLSLLVAVPFLDPDGKIPVDDKVVATLVLIAAQALGNVGWALGVARMKGLGSLRADFGLYFRWVDVAWIPVGIVVFGLASALILPIADLAGLDDSSQDVVKTFERSSGALEQVAFVVAVAVVTPIAEELVFRGILLRGLLRRTTPVWSVVISALTFALVHFLGDAGTGYYVPAFLALGLVSGWAAVVTRRLGPSIALHGGFNLISALIIVS
jgi:membrane protease YdiL (CAAX protease family)